MRKILTVATMLFACSGASAIADDFLGGNGGGLFGPIECPRGTAIVGLAGNAGAVIDHMQLICGTTTVRLTEGTISA